MIASFTYFNEYFDKIFVLTLPRLTERNKLVQKALSGLNYEFFYGVDKSEFTLEELANKGLYDPDAYRSFYKYPNDITLGALCCALGHIYIYEEIIQKGYQRVLILEDDIVLNPSNLSLFPSMVAELPEDWDLLYLGYEKREYFGIKEWINLQWKKIFPYHVQLKMNRELYQRYYPRPFSRCISYAGFHDCTHAYAITGGAAKKLLTYGRPVRFNSDNLLSWMVGKDLLKGFITRPKLFNQLTAFVHQLESLTSS